MNATRMASTIVGVTLLFGAPAAWYLTQPADEVGDVAAITAPAVQDVEVVDDTTRTEEERLPDPLPEPSIAPTAGPSFSTGELSGSLTHQPVPTQLGIPSLGIEAPIVPVALEPDGSMEIPDDVGVVGWYEPGVRPGQDGTAVLSGHVDSRTLGRGALFDLRTMEVGDRIITAGPGGEPLVWNVTARTRYGKAELPIDDIFVWDGPPRLVVITCGGEFDPATRSYSDNVVVVAEPA